MIDVPVEVKDALKDGRRVKHYVITPVDENGNQTDIAILNDNLVAESVIIDERMCSGETLKFGLCEGATIEFQYFNTIYQYNIAVGQRLKVEIRVDYGSAVYPIPLGYFTVQSCSRQVSTGIVKVTAYNKLQSKFLDSKANDYLIQAYNQLSQSGAVVGNITLDELLNVTLEEYKIPNNIEAPVLVFPSYNVTATREKYSYEGYTSNPANTHTVYGYKVYFQFKATSELVKGGGAIKNPTKFFFEKLNDFSYFVAQTLMHNQFLLNASTHSFEFGIHFVKSDGSEFFKALTSQTPDGYESPLFTDYSNQFPAGKQIVGTDFYCYMTIPLSLNDGTLINELTTALEKLDESVSAECVPYTDLGGITVDNSVETWPDVTLRELQTAVFETVAQFGQLNRQTDMFEGVELNQSRLYPSTSLYPKDTCYPDGAASNAFRNQYSQLWADEGNVHKWKYLIITYKSLDGEGNEVEKTLQRTIHANGTDNYNCSDNWLFKNLVWTAEQVGEYADAMVAKMQDITWFPFEMWCAGLPYLETGDEIEIPLGNQTYTSYILQRQLKGIQNLQDTYINGTLDIFG